MVNRRVQMVIAHNRASDASKTIRPLGFWRRFKLLTAGLLLTVLVAGFLAVGLIIGIAMAAVVWMIFATLVALGILRAALRSTRGQDSHELRR